MSTNKFTGKQDKGGRLVLHENESKPGHGLTRIYTDQGGALSEAEGRINLFWVQTKSLYLVNPYYLLQTPVN
jgi:hypothetical protein